MFKTTSDIEFIMERFKDNIIYIHVTAETAEGRRLLEIAKTYEAFFTITNPHYNTHYHHNGNSRVIGLTDIGLAFKNL